MLHEFLSTHRTNLINRCSSSASLRSALVPGVDQSRYGIPLCLDHIIETLEVEQSEGIVGSQRISGCIGGPSSASELGSSAAKHGRELSDQGLTVEQVVHAYGDLCQAITGLAFELDAPILTSEFRTLNRCLDNGIADAVTEFSYQRDLIHSDRESQALNQRLGFLAHDLRDHINAASYAIRMIKEGKVGFAGATGAVLDRSLIGLRSVVDRSLAEARLETGLPVNFENILLADFFADVKATASLEAESRGCQFAVAVLDRSLCVTADRDLLFSAVGNLLQNAFKFTKRGTKVSLTACEAGHNILIEVQDQGDGLPPGNKEELFEPFVQRGADKSGAGLGLAICRRSVEANHGTLSVRNAPGPGCIFSIQLPRAQPATVPNQTLQ